MQLDKEFVRFMSTQISQQDITDCLSDFVPAEKISGLHINDNDEVLFSILVSPEEGAAMEDVRQKAEKEVSKLKGVKKVTVILTAEKPAQAQPSSQGSPKAQSAPDPHGMNKNPSLKLPIKKIIAVASGKGGVGKSTVSVNIAAAMAKSGLKVGLLDADIYGPSVPRLTGLPYERPNLDDNKKLIPFDAHGMKVMSIGFMVDQDTPMIWRGPMVQSAIYQMLRDVAWASDDNPLDVLVIDMPPGTGDAQLTLAQKVEVDGAIIVSTPQDLAMLDAIKAIEMFRKTDVPVLGLVENMSTHVCTNCGHEEHVFGHDLREECKKRDVSYLGYIPLEKKIRENCDAGKLSDLETFSQISKDVLATL